MTTYRIEGIDYDFERHHIKSDNTDKVPDRWVYLIKPPDDCIGGLDLNKPTDHAYCMKAQKEGFILVGPNLYDEFLRSRRIKARKAGGDAGEKEYMQGRYTIQRLRVAMYELDSTQFTWGEWEEYTPSSIGYPPRYLSDEDWQNQYEQYLRAGLSEPQ